MFTLCFLIIALIVLGITACPRARRATRPTSRRNSRAARGIEVWAELHTLGRSGLTDLVERTCRFVARFAEGLRTAISRCACATRFERILEEPSSGLH